MLNRDALAILQVHAALLRVSKWVALLYQSTSERLGTTGNSSLILAMRCDQVEAAGAAR